VGANELESEGGTATLKQSGAIPKSGKNACPERGKREMLGRELASEHGLEKAASDTKKS